jgi:hypothetical protein
MNFITEARVAGEQVELKYCERCGGLFLRTPGEMIVTCPGCRSSLAAEPDIAGLSRLGQRRRKRLARLAKGPDARKRNQHGMPQVGYLQAVATMEAPSW